MKILVSTNKYQGMRENDFCHTTEGEILIFGMECDGEKIDGSCGCRRSMIGIETRKATTTMMVAEVDCDLAELYTNYLVHAGWAKAADDDFVKHVVPGMVSDVKNIADYFPAGTVLEKRGNIFKVRRKVEAEL